MNKFICFHAGGIKTGSTSLQTFFGNNRQILLEKYNICFPDACRLTHLSYITHNEQGIFQPDGHINAALLDEMRRQPGVSFILTNESFFHSMLIERSHLEELRAAFPEHRICCVLYVRRMDEQIFSNFNQFNKERLFYSSRYPHGWENMPAPMTYFDYTDVCRLFPLGQAQKVKLWKSVMGADSAIVRVYDRNSLKHGDVIEDFLSIFDIPFTKDMRRNKDINESLDPRLLPYVAQPLLPDSMLREDRKDAVYFMAKLVSKMQQHQIFSEEFTAQVHEEIQKMDEHCSGFAALHNNPNFSLDFPELEGDPYRQLSISLLYHALDKLGKMEKEMDPITKLGDQITTLQKQFMILINSVSQFVKKQSSSVSCDERQRIRDIYLDTLTKTLCGTIYEDGSVIGGEFFEYDSEIRKNGRDWPERAHTMVGIKRLHNLRMLIEDIIRNNVQGDLIETGVWRGGASIFMRAVLYAYDVWDRRVFVANSFCGLPEPNGAAYPADAKSNFHTFSELSVSIENVKSNFAKYGMLDSQVVFVKGWFKDTLPTLQTDKLALLRLDGDMYESTMDTLVHCYDKVSSGGYIVIDDYHGVPACSQAVDDFRAARGISIPFQEIDGMAVYWKK